MALGSDTARFDGVTQRGWPSLLDLVGGDRRGEMLVHAKRNIQVALIRTGLPVTHGSRFHPVAVWSTADKEHPCDERRNTTECPQGQLPTSNSEGKGQHHEDQADGAEQQE